MRYSLILCVLLGGADWRQFRGTDSSGVAANEKLPRSLSLEKNIVWKAELPGKGPGSAIVVRDRVYVTAASGPKQEQLHVLAFDAATGNKVWHRTFWATGPTAAHPKSSMAAPTPASDGQRVVALFATNDLICLDLDGNVQWLRSLYEENEGATDGRGLASSPVIAGSTVVVHVENQNVSFATGIDIDSGASRWRINRARVYCWTSPIVLPGKSETEPLVLLQGTLRLSAVDPKTGREAWYLDRSSDAISSSVAHGGTLYVPGDKGLAAFELHGEAAPKLSWEKPKISPTTASPLVVGGRVYGLRGAILGSADIKTGEIGSQLRLKGPFSATPVSAGGLIYCVSEEGLVQIVEPGEKEDKILGTLKLDDAILGTPAIAGGALFLRGNQYLWKIGEKP